MRFFFIFPRKFSFKFSFYDAGECIHDEAQRTTDGNCKFLQKEILLLFFFAQDIHNRIETEASQKLCAEKRDSSL